MLACCLYLGSDNIAGGFIEVHMLFTRNPPTRPAALVHQAAFGCFRTEDMILAYMNALAAGDTETNVAV